jgi:hypothetical protein
VSYIGNNPANQNFVAGADQFSGTGSQLAFTLSRNVNTVFDMFVTVSNVPQDPFSAYTVSGSTLTFDSAPPSGTNNIDVVYRATNVQTFLPALGAIGKAQLDVANFNGTGAVSIPTGTTAQRPSTSVTGMQRFNTTLNAMEYWTGSAWSQQFFLTYTVEYLVIAGGGSGGGYGGGGGAGGYRTGSLTVESLVAYILTVGAGGAGNNNLGNSGSNSVFSTITAIGGGRGGRGGASAPESGGSGGGASYAPSTGAAGTAGQGNAGGNGVADLGGQLIYLAGGGGGAGAVGGNFIASPTTSGSGGAGKNTESAWAAATSTGVGGFYAGGGGGGVPADSPYVPGQIAGAGGAGGGGAGASGNATATSGAANTGSGGGGSGFSGSVGIAGSGGSGIIILRYLGAQRGSGGTVISSGGYTYHTFTTSGTYTA